VQSLAQKLFVALFLVLSSVLAGEACSLLVDLLSRGFGVLGSHVGLGLPLVLSFTVTDCL
jgi:hypothetical protein